MASQREPVVDPAPSDLLPTAVLARVVQRAPTNRGKTERVAFMDKWPGLSKTIIDAVK